MFYCFSIFLCYHKIITVTCGHVQSYRNFGRVRKIENSAEKYGFFYFIILFVFLRLIFNHLKLHFCYGIRKRFDSWPIPNLRSPRCPQFFPSDVLVKRTIFPEIINTLGRKIRHVTIAIFCDFWS